MSNQVAHERDGRELVGSVLAGRYRVDRLLGEGGMGRVYLAEHVLMRKPVALKVLHQEMTLVPEVVARFEREAVAAARIDHPNVAQAMDFGRLDDGSLYFVLEYVDGRSLRSLLDEGALEHARSVSLACQIASALVAAHKVGIVHRDLKPDNVMLVSQADGSERVKVLDFGIAKVTNEGDGAVPGKTLTRVGAVMGTAGYMAPEQALGQPVSHLADLYAFGSMFYEMIAGRLPFDGNEVTEIVAKQLTEAPAPLPPGIPPELVQLIDKLLARLPSERVQSAEALLETLEQIARRSDVVTAPTTFLGEAANAALSARLAAARTTVEPARRPAWIGIGLAVLVAFVALVAFGSRHGEPDARSSEVLASAPGSAALGSPTPPASVGGGSLSPAKPASGASSVPPASSVVSTVTSETTESSAGGTKTKKTKRTRVTEEHTVKRTKRRTGPGGIYIPPPSEWFK
jgi:serine/threonine-protein kinase